MEQNIQLYGRNDMVMLQDNKIYGSLGLAEKYIVKTKQGTPPLLLDSSLKSKFLGMNIYGKSTQDGIPTPENPVEIKSVENPTISIYGKNLWDINEWYAFHSGYLSIVGNKCLKVYARKAYTISFDVEAIDTNGKMRYRFYSDNVNRHDESKQILMGNVIADLKIGEKKHVSFVVYPSVDCWLGLDDGQLIGGFQYKNIQIECGEIETDYEPYKQPQTMLISTPNGLHGIPVDFGGNYTDENGQQYVADYVDFERGKYVKRVMCYDLKDVVWTDMWNKPFHIDGTFLVLTSQLNDVAMRGDIDTICSHFIRLSESILTSEKTQCESGQGGGFNIAFRVPITLANSIGEWEQWVSDNNMQLLVPLKMPIETDLTAEEISAYKVLHSNYPTTIVDNSEQAEMSVTYKSFENA